ncbi:MAG TPA: Crp/Fnr family transcriptional regulator [Chryseolinea sp.]|jgi:CRP-like cAMP-binding protein|nr:Crp/Fnr family transcriptional regulator [Chryseolinea sp.]
MTSEQSLIRKILDSADSSGVQKVYAKGDYLIKEGQVEHSVYFIESGAVRVFHVTEFEEQTIRFGYEGSIITSLSSFISGKPSEFYIEALRKTTVKIIPKQTVFAIVNESPETLSQYNQLLQTLIVQQMEREVDLLTESPTKRLQRVLDRSPNLFQEIPLKYIASYLRMTPETLSRIRNS